MKIFLLILFLSPLSITAQTCGFNDGGDCFNDGGDCFNNGDCADVCLPFSNSPTFRVYPNPTADLLFFEENTEGAALSIVATDGRIWRRLDAFKGSSVDVSDLPQGLYVFKFGAFISKFIKI